MDIKITYGIFFLIYSILVSQCNAQHGPRRESPCGQWRFGDTDLNTFDIIREYRLDQYEETRYEGVTQVPGSNELQTAYRLEERSNLTIRSIEAFPAGIPDDFSFECTFRTRQVPQEPWYLFHLTDSYERSQLSVTMYPEDQLLQLGIPDATGHLQTVEFRHTELFDESWHKVMIGVSENQANLFVDCQKVEDVRGGFDAWLKPRGRFDESGGHLSVAQKVAEPFTVQSTPSIDLQWMVMSCDPEKPTRENCDELPRYYAAATGPSRPNVAGPQPECEIECPQGPPGYNGTDGRPGPPGPPGISGQTGFPGLRGRQGLTGARGQPGIPGTSGPVGIPSYGFPGLNGTKGDRGDKGDKGDMGEKGERGEVGEIGERGLAGHLGLQGLSGVQGPKGEPGLPGTNSYPNFATGGTSMVLPGHQGPEGHKGLTGEPGPPGKAGDMGPTGFEGARGSQGLQGVKGDDGVKGEPGTPGFNGAPGIDGRPGIQGIQGYTGAAGQQGQPGQQGPPGMSSGSDKCLSEHEIRDICSGVLREQIGEYTTSFAGPAGTPGRIGRPGPSGETGEPGQRGQSGMQGERGYPGNPGNPGPMGPAGTDGERGDKGESGNDGVGNEGPMGPVGPQGPTGHEIQGSPGRPGDRGETGRQGTQGTTGPRGEAGICPDCYYAAAAAYQYPQQNYKGPQQNYKGPQQNYKGPQSQKG